MISIFFKSYFITLFLILFGSLIFLFVGLYFIFKSNKPHRQKKNIVFISEKKNKSQPITITSHDISAIAGDDVITTQLDLARAYIETGKAHLAKKILSYVMEKGTPTQQQEAQHLLGLM